MNDCEFEWIDCCECGITVLVEVWELNPIIPSDFMCDDCKDMWMDEDTVIDDSQS